LHVGPIPTFDPEEWDFEVEGLVEKPVRFTYKDLMDLPKKASMSDFHCVTGWSRLDNKWEGVSFRSIVDLVKPLNNARYVTIEAEGGYSTSLPLEDLLDDDVVLAYKLDDKPLDPRYGGPLRLVVPKKYAYKSAKWVRKLRFTTKQELGYWERRGQLTLGKKKDIDSASSRRSIDRLGHAKHVRGSTDCEQVVFC